jgi:hypothetical protein
MYKVCPNCKVRNLADSRYCDQCGEYIQDVLPVPNMRFWEYFQLLIFPYTTAGLCFALTIDTQQVWRIGFFALFFIDLVILHICCVYNIKIAGVLSAIGVIFSLVFFGLLLYRANAPITLYFLVVCTAISLAWLTIRIYRRIRQV